MSEGDPLLRVRDLKVGYEVRGRFDCAGRGRQF